MKSFPGHDVVGTLQLLSKYPIYWRNYCIGSVFFFFLVWIAFLFPAWLDNEYELLKKKYLDESAERKRLYNEVIELKGNIRVFCRCRPLNLVEIANGSSSIVEFDSSQDTELQIISADSSKKQFKFDRVFRPEDGQGNLRPLDWIYYNLRSLDRVYYKRF